MFWAISVYVNIRNTLPKSGTFLLGHSVFVFVYLSKFCVNQAFCFMAGGNACSRGNLQQTAQEPVSWCSGDNCMCTGNNIGNLAPRRTS